MIGSTTAAGSSTSFFVRLPMQKVDSETAAKVAYKEFKKAVKAGREDTFLKGIVSVMQTDGTTPLHMAIASGRADLVAKLLELGVRGPKKAEKGESPLALASRLACWECVRHLLQAPDINLNGSGNVLGLCPEADLRRMAGARLDAADETVSSFWSLEAKAKFGKGEELMDSVTPELLEKFRHHGCQLTTDCVAMDSRSGWTFAAHLNKHGISFNDLGLSKLKRDLDRDLFVYVLKLNEGQLETMCGGREQALAFVLELFRRALLPSRDSTAKRQTQFDVLAQALDSLVGEELVVSDAIMTAIEKLLWTMATGCKTEGAFARIAEIMEKVNDSQRKTASPTHNEEPKRKAYARFVDPENEGALLLLQAARDNNIHAVRQLLALGEDPLAKTKRDFRTRYEEPYPRSHQGSNALHLSVWHGDAALVQFVVQEVLKQGQLSSSQLMDARDDGPIAYYIRGNQNIEVPPLAPALQTLKLIEGRYQPVAGEVVRHTFDNTINKLDERYGKLGLLATHAAMFLVDPIANLGHLWFFNVELRKSQPGLPDIHEIAVALLKECGREGNKHEVESYLKQGSSYLGQDWDLLPLRERVFNVLDRAIGPERQMPFSLVELCYLAIMKHGETAVTGEGISTDEDGGSIGATATQALMSFMNPYSRVHLPPGLIEPFDELLTSETLDPAFREVCTPKGGCGNTIYFAGKKGGKRWKLQDYRTTPK